MAGTKVDPQAQTYIPGDHKTEFIFTQGDTIVARVEADCAVCAWRQRPVHLNADMWAGVHDSVMDDEICSVLKRRMRQ